MTEHERGESRWMGAFLLGLLAGVLMTLGGGGAFLVVGQSRGMMGARAAEEAARAEAEAREMAEQARAAEAANERAARREAERAQQEVAKLTKELQDGAQWQQAQRGVTTLDTAIKAHKLLHNEWPATLDVLATGISNKKPAAIEKWALTDPWGRPYVYEVGKVHPQSGVPLVYSVGPEPKNEARHIRNWK